jgi:hypothetical protein
MGFKILTPYKPRDFTEDEFYYRISIKRRRIENIL